MCGCHFDGLRGVFAMEGGYVSLSPEADGVLLEQGSRAGQNHEA